MMTRAPYPVAVPEPTNGLALAGFIVSLAGWFMGGILCPVGLILSLVALRGPGGRGFAIAGIIIGALGTCIGLIAIIFFASIFIAMLAAIGLVAANIPQLHKVEVAADMNAIAAQIDVYREANNDINPADLSLLNLQTDVLTDPWQQKYRYLLDASEPRGYTIISNGPDGQSNTWDDIAFSEIDATWSAPPRGVQPPEVREPDSPPIEPADR
ncbi:MAG: type II secretion system protein GspG [Phycisphaerales bacterium]